MDPATEEKPEVLGTLQLYEYLGIAGMTQDCNRSLNAIPGISEARLDNDSWLKPAVDRIMGGEGPFVSRRQLLKHFGVSGDDLAIYVKRGKFPKPCAIFNMGRRRFWRRSDVEPWLSGKRKLGNFPEGLNDCSIYARLRFAIAAHAKEILQYPESDGLFVCPVKTLMDWMELDFENRRTRRHTLLAMNELFLVSSLFSEGIPRLHRGISLEIIQYCKKFAARRHRRQKHVREINKKVGTKC